MYALLVPMLRCAVGLLVLLTSAHAAPEFVSRLWRTEDGLPNNIVQAITQTGDGYLWVGTREGLVRFDGVHFTTVHLSNDVQPPSINALYEDAEGLWIGTQSNGLFRLHQGALQQFTPKDGLRSNTIRTLAAGSSGSLWILSSSGPMQYSRGRFITPADEQIRGTARNICTARDGTLWAAAGNSLKHYDGRLVTTYTTDNGLASNATRSVYQARNGDLWIGYDGGLSRLAGGKFTHYPQGPGPSAMVSILTEDRHGQLWVGTYAGLYLFNGTELAGIRSNDDTHFEYRAIFEDREGNVWCGGDAGLQRLTPRRFTTFSQKQGLTSDKAVAVCAGTSGSVWIGTWGAGLNEIKNGAVAATYQRAQGLASDFVHSLCMGRDGSLWIGLDYSAGLDRLRDGHFTHFGKEQGLAAATVTVIQDDAEGQVWVGTRNGLFRLRDGMFTRYGPEEGLPNQQVTVLCESHAGGLWIGTPRGLGRWKDGRFERVPAGADLAGDFIVALHEEADGTLWIGTDGRGLKRLKNGVLRTFTTAEGLPGNVVLSILADGKDNLWIASSTGIFAASKAELDEVARGTKATVMAVAYDREGSVPAGGQTGAGPQPFACRSTDGQLWFRTMRGVKNIDPGQILSNPVPPPVVVEQVLADRQVVFDAGPLSLPGIPNGSHGAGEITIGPGRGELQFRYSALSLQSAESNRFKYRLEGIDRDWVDAGTRREAFYAVSSGSYRFRVIASNNDGRWNEVGTEIAIRVQPHFWQTWWFLALAAAGSAGTIAGAVRSLTRRKMLQKLARLERQHALEKERARIAQDIHDDLGASLTEISMLAAIRPEPAPSPARLADRLRRISETSSRLVKSLDAIVWTVDPSQDTLPSLASYLASYATEYLSASPLLCRFDIPADLPLHDVPAETRHHLLLAVKESLHNAVRHSGATEVLLQLSAHGRTLVIAVRDNGAGFQPAGRPAGHGLENLHARLERLQGRCAIDSAPGQGTCVTFTVSLPPSNTHDDHRHR